MLKKSAPLLCVAILISVSLITGCMDRDPGWTEEKNEEKTIDFTSNEVVNSSNRFSFDMYRELTNGTDNVFFSPYSITIALGMAYEGAKEETASQMLDVIDLPQDDDTRRAMVRSLQMLLNPKNSSYNLSTANAYWLKMGGDLNDTYQKTIENDYIAGGKQLDFYGDPSGSADTINRWVENETNGKIKDLVSSGSITPLTYLILTNAIYFKSDWRYQFDTEATEEVNFHLTGSDTVKMEMMHMCDEDIELNYSDNGEVRMLQLPYKNNDLSMYILLPHTNDISSLEEDLEMAYFEDLKSTMSGEWVDVGIPRFKFELKYTLNQYLIDMGMEDAFDPDLADFSGIKEDGSRDLYITGVIHKSFVEVNEEGTEAAAATAVMMGGSSVTEEETPIYFWADHPFIFLIEHQDTGQILFMGKVEDPTQ